MGGGVAVGFAAGDVSGEMDYHHSIAESGVDHHLAMIGVNGG